MRDIPLLLLQEDPYPSNSGAKIRETGIIQLFLDRAERVEVLCFSGAGSVDEKERDPRVLIFRVERESPPLISRLSYPFRPYVINGYSERIAQALRDRAEPGRVLWISRLALAQYVPLAKMLGYRVILDEHNVESDLWLSAAMASPRYYTEIPLALACRYFERKFCRHSDAVVATSRNDARRLSDWMEGKTVHVLPNTVDTKVFQSVRDHVGETLLFMGSLAYRPNIEGLFWFVEKVLPMLQREARAELRIVVAGSRPSSELRQALESCGVRLIADPPSMKPLLEEAALIFVPLLSGSGTRLKILEAMAAGRPVVSTSKGAEGLELVNGTEILVADSPQDFAKELLKLAGSGEMRRRLARAALAKVEARYDWRAQRECLSGILESVGVSGSSAQKEIAR